MKTNKGKQFNLHAKPYIGPEPQKTNKSGTIIWCQIFDSRTKLTLPKDLTGGEFEVGRIFSGDFGDSVEIYYTVRKEVENKSYKRELEEYNRKLKELKEWKIQKEIYDKEQREKEEAIELKNYLRLKKKYGDK